MLTFKEFILNKRPTGTYVCLKPDEETMKMIGRFISDNNILNGVQMSSLHSTVIYSKVHDRTLTSFPGCYAAEFDSVRVMPSDDDKLVIAIELNSPDIQALHRRLLKDHSVTHTYDNYIVHVTVTYDGGQMPETWDIKSIDKPFVFDKMEVQDLDKDWTA